MYGLAGERMLTELELTTLPGYRGASPVRVGNAAYKQYQGDVFGEVMVALQAARELGVEETEFSWPLQRALMSFVEKQLAARRQRHLGDPRPERHFTHSRAMLWAAFDCAISAVDRLRAGRPARPLGRACAPASATRSRNDGFDEDRGTYAQYYGSHRASTRRCCSSRRSAI